jgi:hypothetical protein
MTGVVDRGRNKDGRAAIVVQARLHSEVVDDVGDDPLLAFSRAHQFFHTPSVFHCRAILTSECGKAGSVLLRNSARCPWISSPDGASVPFRADLLSASHCTE